MATSELRKLIGYDPEQYVYSVGNLSMRVRQAQVRGNTVYRLVNIVGGKSYDSEYAISVDHANNRLSMIAQDFGRWSSVFIPNDVDFTVEGFVAYLINGWSCR